MYKEFLEIVGNGKSTDSVLEETIAVTQPNSSPNSFMQQNDRIASRFRSPRVTSHSGRMSRWPCKDYLKGTCTTSFCKKVTPSRMLVLQDQEWLQNWEKYSFAHRQVDEQPTKRSQKNDDKSAIAMLKKNDLHESIRQPVVIRDKSHDRLERPHDNWFVSFKKWSRRSLSYGRAQTCRYQSNVWNSRKLLHVTLKFETNIIWWKRLLDLNPPTHRKKRSILAPIFRWTFFCVFFFSFFFFCAPVPLCTLGAKHLKT